MTETFLEIYRKLHTVFASKEFQNVAGLFGLFFPKIRQFSFLLLNISNANLMESIKDVISSGNAQSKFNTLNNWLTLIKRFIKNPEKYKERLGETVERKVSWIPLVAVGTGLTLATYSYIFFKDYYWKKKR